MTEQRRDPTTGEWHLFTGHRESPAVAPAPDRCRLCPTRPGSAQTDIPLPALDVVVVEDRPAAPPPDPPPPDVPTAALYQVLPANGGDEVVVYSDDHRLHPADMHTAKLARIVAVWADRYAALGSRDDVGYVLIFENSGAGHPHGLISAYPDAPPRAAVELATAAAHLSAHGTCVFCDVVARERADGVRIVAQNEAFVAFVPFAARFPYEVHVMAHRHATSLLDLTDLEREALAALVKVVLGAYRRLFDVPLRYAMAMHQAPTDDGRWLPVSHLHLEYLPPYRTATELVHLGGAELGGGAFVNGARPETSAAALRSALDGSMH